MDTRLAGIQHQSKINHQNIYTVPKPIVTDIAATSSASEIRISLNFTPTPGVLSLYAENGVGGVASLPFSSATTFVGTVGGVSNVRITSNGSLRGLNITRNSGGEFSTNDIQAVIKGLQIKTIDLDTFIPLEFTFTLVKNGSSGPVSTAYFNADLFSTTLDLDATTAGTQLNVTRIINLAGQAEGAGLFAKPIATPRDVDTKSIQLAFSGTLAVTLDKLVLGSYTLAFDTNAPANLVQTIAGVRDVAISYTRSRQPRRVRNQDRGQSAGTRVLQRPQLHRDQHHALQ